MGDSRDIYEYIADLRPLIAAQNWSQLERVTRDHCARLAGREQTERIDRLDFPAYARSLDDAYKKAAKRFSRCDARALYFEYNLDNFWQSGFFICQGYTPASEQDDDWACDWIDESDGPDFPEAGDLYEENHFDRTDMAKGSTLYLVGRTVAAFGRSFETHPITADAVCIAFHDQDPVMRVHEKT